MLKIKHFLLNYGPQHPSVHGVLRLIFELDVPIINKVDPHIGKLCLSNNKPCVFIYNMLSFLLITSFFILIVFYTSPILLKADVSALLDCLKDCRYVVLKSKELLEIPLASRPADWADRAGYFNGLLKSLIHELNSEDVISELRKLPENDPIRERYNVTRDTCFMYNYKLTKALASLSTATDSTLGK